MPNDLNNIIFEYNPRYKLKKLFKKNFDKVDWDMLSYNKHAFDILIKNKDKINYINLALNENSDILLWLKDNFDDILKKYKYNYEKSDELFSIKLNFDDIFGSKNKNLNIIKNIATNLCKNNNEIASEILEKYPKLINWNILYANPNNKAVNLILDKLNSGVININTNELLMNSNNKIVDIILKYPYMIYNYYFLSKNNNPRIISLLENRLQQINVNAFGGLTMNIVSKELENINTHSDINFIQLLKKYPQLINYRLLSLNESNKAIEILKDNEYRIDWNNLCMNLNNEAVNMIFDKYYYDKDKIKCLSLNENEYLVDKLIKHPELIDWKNIWKNPNIFININKKEKTPIRKTIRSKIRTYNKNSRRYTSSSNNSIKPKTRRRTYSFTNSKSNRKLSKYKTNKKISI